MKYTDIINFTNKICLDTIFDEKILNEENEFPSGQIYPINYTNLNNSQFDLLKLKKYVNNKNICNIIIKEYKEFDFENEILKNNKALSLEEETNYYFLLYNNKTIYICTNCYGEAEYDVEFENFFCDTCEMLHEKYSVVSNIELLFQSNQAPAAL